MTAIPASPGETCSRCQASTFDHLRVIVRSVHSWTGPTQVRTRGGSSKFDGDRIAEPGLEARVRELGREATANARVEPFARPPAPAECDD